MSADTALARLTARPSSQLLTLALVADAAVTTMNGVTYLALAGPLGDLFNLPAGFLRAIGGFLVVFGMAVWLVARRRPTLAGVVIAANVAWVVVSLLFPLLDVHAPSTTGTVWIVMQAVTVAMFAVLQAAGVRIAGPALADRTRGQGLARSDLTR